MLKKNFSITTVFMLAVISLLNFSCEEDPTLDEGTEQDSGLSISTMQPMEVKEGETYPSIEISLDETGEELIFGGQFNASQEPINYTNLLYTKEGENKATNILYNGEYPSVIYNTDISTGENDQFIYTFSNFETNSLLCNIYEYNWEDQTSTWLKGIEFQQSGDGFSFVEVDTGGVNLIFQENTSSVQSATHKELFDTYSSSIVFDLFTWMNKENNYEEVFSTSTTNGRIAATESITAVGTVGTIAKILKFIRDKGTEIITDGEQNESATEGSLWDWVTNKIGIPNANASQLDPEDFRTDDDGDGIVNVVDQCPNVKGNSASGCLIVSIYGEWVAVSSNYDHFGWKSIAECGMAGSNNMVTEVEQKVLLEEWTFTESSLTIYRELDYKFHETSCSSDPANYNYPSSVTLPFTSISYPSDSTIDLGDGDGQARFEIIGENEIRVFVDEHEDIQYLNFERKTSN